MYFFGKGILDNIDVGEVLAHIRETDVLTAYRSDWKAIFDYNVYGDPSISLFGDRPKSNNDIVFLLDGSGSMLSEGKWVAAKDAAVLFYQLMGELRHPAFKDRYNSVVFRWPCGGTTDMTTTVPPGTDLKDITVPLSIATYTPYEPLGNYCTPIGRGLEDSIDQFELDTEESFYSNKTILLLSDGKHNRGIDPLSVTIPGGIKVHGVCLGELHIDEDVIRDIAIASEAEYRITPSPREMEDFFCQILCNTSWKLQNITVTGDAAFIDQSEAVFITVWDSSSASISFELDPPGAGSNITPTNLAGYFPMEVTWHPPAPGETHAYYVCKNIPSALLGEWHFANINDGGTPVPLSDVLLKVIEDPRVIADFDIENICHYTGQPIVLSARVTEDGKALTGLTQVYAELVRSPAFAAGNVMAENSPPPGYTSISKFPDPTPQSHYLSGVMEKLGIETLNKIGGPRIYLRDDGKNADSMAGDGIYTGVFESTELEGSYTFKFRAKGQNKNGVTFDRNETLSEYVKFAASPDKTKVEVVSSVTDPKEKIVRATIKVMPIDAFGSYLGPFRGKNIRPWSSSGNFSSKYEDNKDGSYSFTLTYPIGEAPLISVSVGDILVADRMKPQISHAFPYSFSLHFGLTTPMGNLNNYYDPAFSIGLDFDYHLTPQFSAVGLLRYNRFNAVNPSISNSYWWNISANFNLKYEFTPGNLRPYINCGPGIYLPKSGSGEFGFNVGLGLDYSLTPKWIIELGGDYHHIFSSGNDTKFLISYIGLIYRYSLE